MASKVEICNKGLQLLGAKRITDLAENSRNAKACNFVYESLKRECLRLHVWMFSIKRADLAADSPAPSWGRANSFTLPSDFIRLAKPYPEDDYNSRDWLIEGKKILTDESAPLYIRYVYDVTDPNEMDSLFIKYFSAEIANTLCEEITQSNTKQAKAIAERDDALAKAKKINAIEQPPQQAVEDPWVTVRS